MSSIDKAVVLRVANLRKTFPGGVQALKGISFQVTEGEVFAFLGSNGSGKSTTQNIISGILEPDSGEVEILGLKPGSNGALRNVGIASGESQFLWSMTLADLLKFYRRVHGVNKDRLQYWIKRFNMEERLLRTWGACSNGEKTRFRLIKALMHDPRILLLDEPTVGLDPDAAEETRKALRELHKSGITIFLTSHDMHDIESLADRVCFIEAGELQFTGSLDDITSHLQRLGLSIPSTEAGLREFFIRLCKGEL